MLFYGQDMSHNEASNQDINTVCVGGVGLRLETVVKSVFVCFGGLQVKHALAGQTNMTGMHLFC